MRGNFSVFQPGTGESPGFICGTEKALWVPSVWVSSTEPRGRCKFTAQRRSVVCTLVLCTAGPAGPSLPHSVTVMNPCSSPRHSESSRSPSWSLVLYVHTHLVHGRPSLHLCVSPGAAVTHHHSLHGLNGNLFSSCFGGRSLKS